MNAGDEADDSILPVQISLVVRMGGDIRFTRLVKTNGHLLENSFPEHLARGQS
jgi:hypothetical protein